MAFLLRFGRRPSFRVPDVPAPIITAFRRSMMTLMKRDIISTEMVKPSSPTPRHLQRYKLSLLDQTMPSTLVPIVLYFSNSNNHSSLETTTKLLKRSLSLILTRFYPLAGRINNDAQSVDCNDEGVPFVVAKMENGHMLNLSDFLKNPDISLANQLLPYENLKWHVQLGPGSSVAMVQLTRFDCGGLAIGAIFWHGMMDAASSGHFLKCWAHTSLGSGYKEAICPNYIASSLFPQCKEAQQLGSSTHDLKLRRGKFIMHRYVFDADTISALRSKLPHNIKRPSRVETTSALILRCFMVAARANEKLRTILTIAVNLRRRAHPPLPSDCFGNIILGTPTSYENSNNSENNLGEFVEKIRASTRMIDSEFIDRMAGDGGFSGLMENFTHVLSELDLEGADSLVISSFCNFGLYNIDFGWGKPDLVTLSDSNTHDDGESPSYNFVWLNDTRSGDGVEAWVRLDEKYMEVFDSTLQKLRATA